MNTMVASSIDTSRLNCSGLTNEILCAYRAPAMPVSAADSANDTVL